MSLFKEKYFLKEPALGAFKSFVALYFAAVVAVPGHIFNIQNWKIKIKRCREAVINSASIVVLAAYSLPIKY